MKKFCNKITKQQWRVTVPNINSNLFRKSPTKDERNHLNVRESKRTSSGSYDLQAAERDYQVSNCLPNSLPMDADLDSSDSEADENFQDARAVLGKSSVDIVATPETDAELYVDVNSSVHSDGKSLNNNGKYECDVPKISFSFFGAPPSDQYEAVSAKKHKSEVKIVLACPENFDVGSDSSLSNDRGDGFDAARGRCSTPNETAAMYTNESFGPPEGDAGMYTNGSFGPPESPVMEVYQTPVQQEPRGDGESVVSQTETRVIDLYLTKSLEELRGQKCGSDPNISLRPIKEEADVGDSDDDDGLYKVPRPIRRHRLSQSLHDFNVEKARAMTSAEGSVEHISCSQVLVEKSKTDSEIPSSQNSANMEYCKVRSNLPARIRRVTLLRKPKTKAVDTWMHLKTKVNNMIADHSSQHGDRDKFANNIEEMYKSSKDKCRKVLRQTGKIFKVKRDQENVDPNCDSSSQIVKNDAFFANIKNGDAEFKCVASRCDSADLTDVCDKKTLLTSVSVDSDRREEFDFHTLKSAFRRSRLISPEGQNGFDDIRRYVKQGGDFCKELSTILQERSEAEIQYAKSLSKLSNKLARACRDGVGGLNEAWRAVALELETRAEGHRLMGAAILEDAAKPLRTLTETQHRARKQAEAAVDKAARGLGDWRAGEAKTKKHSHTCARENEKLQDAMLDTRLSRSTSLIHLAHIHKTSTDKENAKLEGKKRKAEDAVKKADIEYYTLCVRAERARLEWESAVVRGASTFQSLEEERLNNLKSILVSYLNHSNELGPRLIEAMDRLKGPSDDAEPAQDLSTFISLRQSSQQISEQLLPDFYCEHITLAMNRERRKQALIKLLHLIKQDIERERKSKNGLENLSRAIKQTPNFGAEDSNQSVTEKLYHMKSMLTYLEGARYKVQSALAELDSRPRTGHPLAPHITITRDKSGLQQSVLKVPQWLRDQWSEPEKSPVSEKSVKSDSATESIYKDLSDPEWTDRGTADGNSNQPDSDFDEFSSQASSAGDLCTDENPLQPIAQCKALFAYTPNLADELTLHPGDVLAVYRQQDDGWWLGECNGSVGIFPATYVETLPSNVLKC